MDIKRNPMKTYLFDMPKCAKCKSNKNVKCTGPDLIGSCFWCSKCRIGWSQST